MNEFRVDITQTAFDDLVNITLYIKEVLKEPEVAKNQVDRIKQSVFSLRSSPQRHSLVRDAMLAERGYRSMPVDNYTIFYIADEHTNTVTVLRVQYSRRNWTALL